MSATEPRTCRRHEWASDTVAYFDSHGVPQVRPPQCVRCGRVQDPIASRRGRSSSRLGKDQERRAERRYGWEKIGERGEKTDLRGRLFKAQMKASRKAPPALFVQAFAGLDAVADGRVPLLLLSYVRHGLPTQDFVVIRGEQWLELHGVDEPDER